MKKYEVPIWILVGVLIVVGLYIFFRSGGVPEGKYDAFAQCLAQKGVTMYGAAWCQACQREKANFGSAFRFIPYVECPENAKQCLDLGIGCYPTWIFPGGKKLEGYQGLENLSRESGCELPAD